MSKIEQLIGKVIWNFIELFNIQTKHAPTIFGWMIGSKGEAKNNGED